MKRYLVIVSAIFLLGGCVRSPTDQTFQESSIAISVQNNTQDHIQVLCEIHNQIMIKEKIIMFDPDHLFRFMIDNGFMVGTNMVDTNQVDTNQKVVWKYKDFWEYRKKYFPHSREVRGPSCTPLIENETYVCEECNNEKDKYMKMNG